jgi:hypothetical protein
LLGLFKKSPPYLVLPSDSEASLTSFGTASPSTLSSRGAQAPKDPSADASVRQKGFGATFPTLSSRGAQASKDPSADASGRQKSRLGATAHPCPPEARKRRGTPRLTPRGGTHGACTNFKTASNSACLKLCLKYNCF